MPYSGASSSLGSQYGEVKNSRQVQGLEDEGQAFLADEDEDTDDEQDGRYATEEYDPLYGLVDVPVGVAAIETVAVTRVLGLCQSLLHGSHQSASGPRSRSMSIRTSTLSARYTAS